MFPFRLSPSDSLYQFSLLQGTSFTPISFPLQESLSAVHLQNAPHVYLQTVSPSLSVLNETNFCLHTHTPTRIHLAIYVLVMKTFTYLDMHAYSYKNRICMLHIWTHSQLQFTTLEITSFVLIVVVFYAVLVVTLLFLFFSYFFILLKVGHLKYSLFPLVPTRFPRATSRSFFSLYTCMPVRRHISGCTYSSWLSPVDSQKFPPKM